MRIMDKDAFTKDDFLGEVKSVEILLTNKLITLKHGYMGFAKVPIPNTFWVRVCPGTPWVCPGTPGYAQVCLGTYPIFFF